MSHFSVIGATGYPMTTIMTKDRLHCIGLHTYIGMIGYTTHSGQTQA